jgi:hypothetical protein
MNRISRLRSRLQRCVTPSTATVRATALTAATAPQNPIAYKPTVTPVAIPDEKITAIVADRAGVIPPWCRGNRRMSQDYAQVVWDGMDASNRRDRAAWMALCDPQFETAGRRAARSEVVRPPGVSTWE